MDKTVSQFLPLHATDYLVLFSLTAGERHGYGLVKDVESLTEGLVKLDPSNLYRTIKRLIDRGLVAESKRRKVNHADGERRRYYVITPLGKRVVSGEAERLGQLADAARASRLIPGA